MVFDLLAPAALVLRTREDGVLALAAVMKWPRAGAIFRSSRRLLLVVGQLLGAAAFPRVVHRLANHAARAMPQARAGLLLQLRVRRVAHNHA